MTAAPSGARSKHQISGDHDAFRARVAVLHNRWRIVWRLSVDRKKLLQDTLDHLLEVIFLHAVRIIFLVESMQGQLLIY